MLTRRDLGKLTLAGLSPQTVFAQHAAVEGAVPANTVWLNANENPEGPPPEAKEAISKAITDAGRYNHRVFPLLNEVLAASADVERLATAAKKAGGGVIHLGNPNNPTSSITPKSELRWLAEHLPPDTVLLIDEAYMHFADSQEVESAIAYVREGRSVIATRTFSKLYGMAGGRGGFCWRPARPFKRM